MADSKMTDSNNRLPIKGCVFDAYGTLFDVHSAVNSCADKVGPSHAGLSAVWRKKQLEYTWLRSLMNRYEDFWQVTGDALDFAMDAYQIDNKSLHGELMQAYLTLEPFPEVKEILTLLKRCNIPTAILTNGSQTMVDAAVKSAGLDDLIDHSLSVDELRIYKPDPKVYQLAVDALGIPADNIAFQSSNAWDASGAATFGFQVAWINRYAQPVERLPGDPVATFKDLTGLPGLVGVC